MAMKLGKSSMVWDGQMKFIPLPISHDMKLATRQAMPTF